MDLITLALAKKYTDKKFSGAIKFGGFQIVDNLPGLDSDISYSTVYLKKSPVSSKGNVYEEFIFTMEDEWESLGTTVDLEGYITEETLAEALKTVSWNDLQDKPFYENNIYIPITNEIFVPAVQGESGGTGYFMPINQAYFTEGKKYCVYSKYNNDTEYKKEQYVCEYDGRFSYLGERLRMEALEGDYSFTFYPEDSSYYGACSFYITEEEYTLVQIETKYLPMDKIIAAVIAELNIEESLIEQGRVLNEIELQLGLDNKGGL